MCFPPKFSLSYSSCFLFLQSNSFPRPTQARVANEDGATGQFLHIFFLAVKNWFSSFFAISIFLQVFLRQFIRICLSNKFNRIELNRERE